MFEEFRVSDIESEQTAREEGLVFPASVFLLAKPPGPASTFCS